MKLRQINPDTYINVGIGNVAAVTRRFGQVQIVLSSGQDISAEPERDIEVVVRALLSEAL